MSAPGSGGAGGIEAHNPFVGNRLGFEGLPAVTGAAIAGRVIEVAFADGRRRRYHHQWLRHCCYCRECGNPADGIRGVTVVSFDSAITPADARATSGDLQVTWPDGHRSAYGADWLIHNSYDDADRARRSSWRPVLWRSELAEDFPTVEWSSAGSSDAGRLEMYRLLRDFGVVRVGGLGADPERTEALASLLGPIHETTVYGRIYDVRAEPVSKLGAKTGMAQAPHIDDAFQYSPPGIDVFHCLAGAGRGGSSTYVDGFAVAADIRAAAPDAYELLTTLPVSHIRWHPGEIDMRSRSPLIALDPEGRVRGIRYFDRSLAPLDVPSGLIEPLYDAVREFNRRITDPGFTAEIRVAPGEGVLIDNHRVLHGRTAFDPASGRHIRLCHVPREEFHGRLRELTRRLDPAGHDIHLPSGSAT